jgi:hypothetical protein
MTQRDPSELEQRLRRALRPGEPPAGFTDSVMAALHRAREQQRSRESRSPALLARLRRRPAWLPAAAAAALAVVLAGAGIWNQQRAQELRAREARRQVLEALTISSRALNTALHASVDPSRSG